MEANGQFLFCAQGHLHGYNCKSGGRTKIVDVHLGEKWLKKTRKGILLIFYLLIFKFPFCSSYLYFAQIKKNPFFRAFLEISSWDTLKVVCYRPIRNICRPISQLQRPFFFYFLFPYRRLYPEVTLLSDVTSSFPAMLTSLQTGSFYIILFFLPYFYIPSHSFEF